jgi:hypothetical protein
MNGDQASENWSLPTPQRGHAQSAGRSSKEVPGAMPLSGSPTAGSYSYPQTSQMYFAIIVNNLRFQDFKISGFLSPKGHDYFKFKISHFKFQISYLALLERLTKVVQDFKIIEPYSGG